MYPCTHCATWYCFGSLVALRQHPEVQQNDEQTNSLGNYVPHINAPSKFNQDTSKSARERCNRLLRERHATQLTKSAGPFETPQERSNCLRRQCRTVQQATTCA